MYQIVIPDKLSEERYISGIHALNLPAPEGTSGDWHFINAFFRNSETSETVILAGKGEEIDTNYIFGSYGIYMCNEALKCRGLKAQSETSYAANHFRAILDRLYRVLIYGRYPGYIQGNSEEFLDTEEEKRILLEKAEMMFPYLTPSQSETLKKWIDIESKPGYRA